ncbi:MAG: helix-hairpin-helix domain-containing protein [Desulfovibrionaceae bacterium]|jgi:competence protein ComEA|nr:helix-hairpin-helix domain-containing protein [Desulfovibrionaceae bacterium]
MKNWLATLLVLVTLATAGIAFAQDDTGKMNLNTVTQEQLVGKLGLAPDLARQIIEQREKNGEFVDMDELLDVQGIDPDLLRKLKEKLYVKPASNCNC